MPHIGNFPGPGYPQPLVIHPAAFMPRDEGVDWLLSAVELRRNTGLTSETFYAPLFLPQGATITQVTLFGHRLGAGELLRVAVERQDLQGAFDNLCTGDADWTDGYGSIAVTAISYAVVDNDAYCYYLWVTIDPDAAATSPRLTGVKIDWK